MQPGNPEGVWWRKILPTADYLALKTAGGRSCGNPFPEATVHSAAKYVFNSYFLTIARCFIKLNHTRLSMCAHLFNVKVEWPSINDS